MLLRFWHESVFSVLVRKHIFMILATKHFLQFWNGKVCFGSLDGKICFDVKVRFVVLKENFILTGKCNCDFGGNCVL